MDEPMNTAANDSTNAPEQATEPATTNIPADAAETMLGGTGTTTEQKEPEAEAKETQPAGAPEQYDFKATIPEGTELDETITKEFSEIARGMNLTNDQANQMAAYGIKYGQQIADAVRSQYQAQVTGWGEQAKAELGANLDKTLSTAGAGIEAAEKQIPGLRQALNETGAGNRIEIIKLCEMLGHLVQADPGKLVNVTSTPAPTQAPTWYPNSKM